MRTKRTCGSAHSSLPAPAHLATDVLEAAGTTYLRLEAKKQPRGSFRDCQRKRGLRVRLDDTPKLNELPQAPRNYQRAKNAERLDPKGDRSRSFHYPLGTRGQTRLPVYQAGANSSMLLGRNMVNLTFRLTEAGVVARPAVGMTGRGNWRKQTPFGNRTDRSCHITPPRKRADFQGVVHYETAGRTFSGGNRK